MSIEPILQQFQGYSSLKLAQTSSRGIEKEALRVTLEGNLSQQFHPKALGSKLTHPYITTDYSEALVELITPIHFSITGTLAFLNSLHCFVYQHLPPDELLWGNSMPCFVTDEKDIPIADYGTSAIGQMKTLYRQGLAHRYGKTMQTIAGIHYNHSFPPDFWLSLQRIRSDRQDIKAFTNDASMGLVRNFLRHYWLIIYLFGASPAVCQCFDKRNILNLAQLGPNSNFSPYATSLRMSDAGYHNATQAQLQISYNSLNDYIQDLIRATNTPEPSFTVFDKLNPNIPQQLNTHILQIEAEFYAPIRPKRTTHSGERPMRALQTQGIEYFEIRVLDINPFAPLGIEARQIALLECVLVYCAILESPPITANEQAQIESYRHQVVLNGRDPALSCNDKAQILFQQLEPIAGYLDSEGNTSEYSEALQHCKEQSKDPDNLLSGRVLRLIQEEHDHCFFDFAMAQSRQHKRYFKQKKLPLALANEWSQLSAQSLLEQKTLEAKPQPSLQEAINDYLSMP